MPDSTLDPGPLPAVVEPASPAERTLVVSTLLGQQVGVTSGDGSGLVWLTLRIREHELTVGLAPFQVDEVCRLLAAACPVEALPGHLDPRPAVTVEQVHQVLASHQADVAWFRRRSGWAWWCGCLTDGTDTHPSAAEAWHAAARHQAGQVAAALAPIDTPGGTG